MLPSRAPFSRKRERCIAGESFDKPNRGTRRLGFVGRNLDSAQCCEDVGAEENLWKMPPSVGALPSVPCLPCPAEAGIARCTTAPGTWHFGIWQLPSCRCHSTLESRDDEYDKLKLSACISVIGSLCSEVTLCMQQATVLLVGTLSSVQAAQNKQTSAESASDQSTSGTDEAGHSLCLQEDDFISISSILYTSLVLPQPYCPSEMSILHEISIEESPPCSVNTKVCHKYYNPLRMQLDRSQQRFLSPLDPASQPPLQ